MFVSYIEECKPTMQQLQFLKQLKKQIQEGTGKNDAAIARNSGVNRSTVSRYFKNCIELGIVSENGEFTKAGEEILSYYINIEKELYAYFEHLGVEGQEAYQAIEGMLDHVDIRTIQKLCQKEKLHLQVENLRATEKEEVKYYSLEEMKTYFQHDIFEVDFSIYRKEREERKLSMADDGFEKPAVMSFVPENEYLELTVREIQAYSGAIDGLLLEGYAQTIKYQCLNDGFKKAEEVDGKIRLPLDQFRFESSVNDEFVGMIVLMITPSIGKVHMPESAAILMVHI